MTKCKWCYRPIHQQYLSDCYECRNLFRLIEKQPAIAQAMLISNFQGVFNTEISNEARSCQETALVDSGGIAK